MSKVSVSLNVSYLGALSSISVYVYGAITEKSTSSGSFMGNSLFSTGTMLPSSKYIMGIGQPQYLCLDIPQSFNLKFIFLLPNFLFSISFIAFSLTYI